MNYLDRLKRFLFLATHNPLRLLILLVAAIKSSFVAYESPVEKKLEGGVIFRFDFDFDPAIKSMYLGTYEMDTVEAMKRLLRRGDTFIDVGANIGYLSTVALGLVGEKGQVHSFEPVLEYFARLNEIALLNKRYGLVVNRCALGEIEGTCRIAVSRLSNIGWNTIVPGFMDARAIKTVQEVAIRRLDNYIEENRLDNISLIKIDTEGYELPVLKGLSKYLEVRECRPAIICEIAPAAYPLLGYKVMDLVRYMDKFKYGAFLLGNPKRKLNILTLYRTANVLFLSPKTGRKGYPQKLTVGTPFS